MTLIQTGKFQRFPIVLMGKDYHSDLYEHLTKMIKFKAIDPADIDLFLFTDSVEEAVAHIAKHAIEGFGLKKRKKYRPFKLFGEHNGS